MPSILPASATFACVLASMTFMGCGGEGVLSQDERASGAASESVATESMAASTADGEDRATSVPDTDDKGRTEASSSSDQPLKTGLSFVFVPRSTRLRVAQWAYREVASRHWLVGCFGYDVLQGTGFNPSTWYHVAEPVLEPLGYRVVVERTHRASVCGARIDEYNDLRLEYLTSTVARGFVGGHFSVRPDGGATEATVTCRISSGGFLDEAIRCDDAHVRIPKTGTVTIAIELEN